MSERIENSKYFPPDMLASYVEALKHELDWNSVGNDEVKKVVKNLPDPDRIRRDFSEQECRIVFESVHWAWKKLSGQDILTEIETLNHPEEISGNFWFLKDSIIFEGPNHFTIAKKNMDIFINLLNMESFVFHEKIASPPSELIHYVILNGGVRSHIKNKKGYFQLTDDTYGKWAKKKIKSLDLNEKIVKLIDRRKPYKGWGNGIVIKV